MSWTLTKKLDTSAGPGEIKRREAVLDPQESPEEIKSREVELGSESWTSFDSVVTQQQCYGHCLSAQPFKQQLRGTRGATQWRRDTALTVWLFWRPSGAVRVRAFTLSPPPPLPAVPVPNRPPRLCGRNGKMFTVLEE